ncbi:Protein of unknown function [Treponema bryantii]|uniref:DUF262 domain-containing protein n=1 Tax=Treponema bryantii TaxID=163 RepID=A0A1I3LLU3_9SPIR|nr:DUF262 domain-containing protein [Treponema bryantii]SFI85682.1 Protein of unknown function [Treponema bryantii]
MTKEINIVKNNSPFFNTTQYDFMIPLYQRAFAWGDEEINKLIDDINDFNKFYDNDDRVTDDNYYIGTLVVYKNYVHNQCVYEVIDGQQRLTALFLLLNYLNYEVRPSLRFEHRTPSNNAIDNINQIIDNYKRCNSKIDLSIVDSESIQDTIKQGIGTIHDKFTHDSINIEKFQKQLEKVILFQVEVPDGTDLNRYFEIMNTRGEQLEQQDILKANLMSFLDNEEGEVFSKIWNACSNMNGYVQMNFDVKSREIIFGKNWRTSLIGYQTEIFADYLFKSDLKVNYLSNRTESKKITDIIKATFSVEDEVIEDTENNRIRFESIINFSHFLLHCLKVYIEDQNLVHKDNPETPLIPSLLDDKKLLKSFDSVLDFGRENDNLIKQKKKDFSKQFIALLLKCRFLFDNYILKREYINENKDGIWSLQEFHVSQRGTKKSPYFTKTNFYSSDLNDYCNQTLMIQAAMRVSYTSPKIMHWITELLTWSYKQDNPKNFKDYCLVAENYVRKNLMNDFFAVEKYKTLGVATPHIVFNYLDYLIWKKNPQKYEYRKNNPDSFTFEFRTSVEHWYPQHPNEKEGILIWDDVDRFGNLCIIQRNINSRFSNQSPKAKKDDNTNEIKKGSLKLRKMASIITNCSNDDWKNSECEKHEKEMLSILEKDCYSYEALGKLISLELLKKGFEEKWIGAYKLITKKIAKDEYIYFFIYENERKFEIGFVRQDGFLNSANIHIKKLNYALDNLMFNKLIFYSISQTNTYRNKWISRHFKINISSFDAIFFEIYSLLEQLYNYKSYIKKGKI